jgi:Domain of unknown function (DUF4259)
MGTWAADAFGNDTACDWSYGLEKVKDLSLVRQALNAVLSASDEYLESDVACEGLAACETIARLKGNWGLRNPYTEAVDQWVKALPMAPSAKDAQAAVAVIERILTPPSELLELWDEGDATEWRAAVDDLRQRVGA